jgi:tyrosyl-tRNA synthetase
MFVKKDIPDEMPTYTAATANEPLVDLLVQQQLAKSKTEARTLIKQGSVQLDGTKVVDLDHVVDCSQERVLRVGKLRFLRILPA